MTSSDARRRPRPSDRFAGLEHTLDIRESLRALRAEGSAGGSGHRQITLMHEAPVRLVLFAFEAGGRLPQHRAPGWVTIHVLSGRMQVRTPEKQHDLAEGQVLALAPNVLHDVDAPDKADMLLGVYPETPVNAAAAPETTTG